ncbi:ATP-binding cassette domain-containing protein [Pseudorhodoferax sp. Leaf267]|uniref:ABC transporter ATP-binding protein n=1 Tax=Pseudorhodoferax sp. Leaf267 TaxID=1736316 RepID=UPI0006F8949E|nr:ATP-binding cassette domain-containing protein [Pseudorhodoferax sp. Leaf267]KQP14985.1 ABC transporter [Pseudorhodoferax sp. Leaf267]
MQVERLRFAYPGEPVLVRDWSATIAPGITELHGDTGSGKTTLLRVLAGELPAAGRLTLGGAVLAEAPDRYRRQVFYIDPGTERFHALTGRACIAALAEGDAGFDGARCEALVQGFGLEPHIEKPLYMLSTGSRRKVWLAAALASGRPLTLLDEPTAALDSGSIRHLWSALADVAARRDRAVLLASSERIEGLPLAASIFLPL